MLILFMFVAMLFSGLVVYTIKHKHLLLMLLGLEMAVVSLYLGLFLGLSYMNYEYFFSTIFLAISVCEGALSLALLVMMIRTHGNDYILTFTSLW